MRRSLTQQIKLFRNTYSIAQAQKKQLYFYCMIMLLALHIALICTTTLSFDQVHVKHEQPQAFSADLHVTIGTI